MNDLTSFADLVRTMREAQKKYFKNHTQTDLQRAKFLERQVDTQLEKLPKRRPGPAQLPLTQEKAP